MRVSLDDVKKIASLSMIHVGEEQQATMQKDLDEILAHAERLNELDTSDVEPTTYITKQQNVLRADAEGETWDKEALLSNAKEKEDGFFVVPQVVD